VRRNVLILVVVECLFGLSFGVYELAFPLFLDDNGVRIETIGLVLAAGAAVNFLIVVHGGRLADRFGRKGIYGLNYLALGVVSAATPLVPHVAYLTVLKTLQQACTSLSRSLRGVLVYESVKVERFTRVFGQVVGLETTCHTLGFACVGFAGIGTGAALSYRGLFLIGGAALAAAAILFAVLFREVRVSAPTEVVRLSLRTLFAFDLHHKLYLIIAAGFIIGVGFGISHAVWMLYFRRQLEGPWAGDLAGFDAWLRAVWPRLAAVWTGGEQGAQFALISLIAILHRLMMGVPMFFLAPLLTRRFKGLYVAAMAVQGLVIAAPAVVDWTTGSFLLVTVAWVIHDMLGASVWVPIQERFIQQYSRPQRRAADVAKAKALMALGLVLGVALAGPVMAVDPALPFFVGGGLISLASLILIPL